MYVLGLWARKEEERRKREIGRGREREKPEKSHRKRAPALHNERKSERAIERDKGQTGHRVSVRKWQPK